MLIIISGVFIGTLLLVLVYLLPVKEDNQTVSYDILEKEGWYPTVSVLSQSYDTYFHSFLPGVLDNHTDSIMLNEVFNTEKGSLLKIAMSMGGYSYYWHGYVSILRPLLYLFDYGDLRVLNGLLQMLLMFFLACIVYKKRGWPYALLMLTSYALLMPHALSMSLQFTWVFYIAFGGCLLLLIKQDIWKRNSRYFYFFLAVGMFTSYFDLLTYPLITWGIPVIWWLIMNSGESGKEVEYPNKSVRNPLLQVILSGVHWIVGYAFMWVSKWMLGSIILNRNVVKEAMEEVFFRAGVAEVGSTTLVGRFTAMYTNLKHFEYKIYLIILICWILFGIFSSIRNGWCPGKNSKAFFLIELSSIVWYFVLSNHTTGHHFFTYRIYVVSITAFLAMLIENIYYSKTDRVYVMKFHSTVGTCIGWAVILIIAFGVTFFIKENVMVHNVESVYWDIPVNNGSIMECSFTPRYSHITDITLCMKSEGTEGYYDILLLYEGETVYRVNVPIADFEGYTNKNIKVDWHLHKGREYKFQITVNEANGQVYALVTEISDMSLEENGILRIDGDESDGQLLCMINYKAQPTSKRTLLCMTLFAMVVLTSCIVLIDAFLLRKKHRYFP